MIFPERGFLDLVPLLLQPVRKGAGGSCTRLPGCSMRNFIVAAKRGPVLDRNSVKAHPRGIANDQIEATAGRYIGEMHGKREP